MVHRSDAVPTRIQESDMNQSVMDHWTTVKRIHQSALDIDPSARAAFLDDSCAGDEGLRREVESLLTYASEAESFLERPAVDIAPTPPGGSHEASLVGRTISHYQVRSLLGAGGMGEVYLAGDPRLDRTVALKILPGELAVDADRMQRFTREAKAASALNHPNAATIYDVGESDGIPFIAMEHVEGETLLARISRRMTPLEVVDIAVQTADALDVAHAKGIRHRDIKPANLMLTDRGHVKVLDFGSTRAHPSCGSGADDAAQPGSPVGAGTDHAQMSRQASPRPLPVGARSVNRPLAVEASARRERGSSGDSFSARCSFFQFEVLRRDDPVPSEASTITD